MMPLHPFSCPSGHRVELLTRMSDADAPRTCECGQPLVRQVAAPAPAVVAGRKGAREGVVVETERRNRETDSGFTMADWRCDAEGCGRTWFEVYKGDAPASEPCPGCGAAGRRQVGAPDVDWFTKQYAATGGYFDRGLGCWIRSLEHRRQVMEEQGVVEYGEVGDIHDAYQRKAREKARQEDEVVKEMLRSYEHGPDSAALKKARDEGRVQDWSWAVKNLGGLD